MKPTITKSKLLAGGCALAVLGLATWHFLMRTPPAVQATAQPLAELQAKRIQPPVATASETVAHHIQAKSEFNQPNFPKGSGVRMLNKLLHQEQIAILVEDYQLPLTKEEIAKVQAVYDDVFEIRQKLEAGLAKVTVVDSLHHTIEIPPYTNEGTKLKEALIADIRAILGSIKAELFLSKTWNTLSNSNNSWGMSDQIIEVSYIPEANVYEFTHGLSYADNYPLTNIVAVSKSAALRNRLGEHEFLKDFLPAGNAPSR